MSISSDLQVELVSNALEKKEIDLIISGSIAATESIRLIRALRRLSADVFPTLTKGGAQFITPMAVSWAAAQPVIEEFNGLAPHISCRDICVIAPASANFIRKIAYGITDSPASALVASYLGAKKPVYLLPSMHDSLMNSPAVQENLNKISSWLTVLPCRMEEHKNKFPEPHILADQIAHNINSKTYQNKKVLITMGPTRAFIDDVRYLSNISTGMLGSLITEECYRRGLQVDVIAGPCQRYPTVYTTIYKLQTYQEMLERCELMNDIDGGIFCAAVCDYLPIQKQSGKIASQLVDLNIAFKPTEKIITKVHPKTCKVGFKLVEHLDDYNETELVKCFMEQNQLTMCVVNSLQAISAEQHHAQLYFFENKIISVPKTVTTKIQIAEEVFHHLRAKLKKMTLA